MSGQNGHRCPYCRDRFETQERLDQHVPCPSDVGDVVRPIGEKGKHRATR